MPPGRSRWRGGGGNVGPRIRVAIRANANFADCALIGTRDDEDAYSRIAPRRSNPPRDRAHRAARRCVFDLFTAHLADNVNLPEVVSGANTAPSKIHKSRRCGGQSHENQPRKLRCYHSDRCDLGGLQNRTRQKEMRRLWFQARHGSDGAMHAERGSGQTWWGPYGLQPVWCHRCLQLKATPPASCKARAERLSNRCVGPLAIDCGPYMTAPFRVRMAH